MNDNLHVKKEDLEILKTSKDIASLFGFKKIGAYYSLVFSAFLLYLLFYININLVRINIEYIQQDTVNKTIYFKNKYQNYETYVKGNTNFVDFVHLECYNIYYYGLVWGVIYPSIMICIFDVITKNSNFWDYSFENTYPKKLLTTSETRRENRFVKYPINAYSSLFLFYSGNYFILRSNYVYNQDATYYLGLMMHTMGTFSFVWWASGKTFLRYMDNIFVEIHPIYLGLTYFTLIDKDYITNINIIITLLIIFRYITLKTRAKLGLAVMISKSCEIILCYIKGNVGNLYLYYLGVFSILIGFYLKVMDDTFNYKWGTGWFHLFASLAVIIHYEWGQTLLYY